VSLGYVRSASLSCRFAWLSPCLMVLRQQATTVEIRMASGLATVHSKNETPVLAVRTCFGCENKTRWFIFWKLSRLTNVHPH